MNLKQAIITTALAAALSVAILEGATAANNDGGFMLPPPSAEEVSVQEEVARAIKAAFKNKKVGKCRTAKLKLNPGTRINKAYISRGIRKVVKGARISRVKKLSPYLLSVKYIEAPKNKETLKRLCLSFEGKGH